MKRTLLLILTCLAVMTIKAQDQKIYTSDDAAKDKSITPPVFKLYTDGQLHVTDPAVGNLPYEVQWMVKNYRRPTDIPSKVDVRISYVVEKDGKLSNIKIDYYRPKSGSHTTPPSSLKTEVQRLLGTMKKWTPAKKQGRAIRFKNVSNLYLMEYALALKEKKDYEKSINELKVDEETVIYEEVDEFPDFPGGLSAYHEWIQKNQKKPEDNKIGRCFLNFIVEKDGSFSEIKVVKSSGDEKLDEEAIRLMKTMPRWIPGKRNGKRVRCRFLLPISFK